MKLILIGGPSGAGKTTVATALIEALGQEACHLLSLDNYYADLSHLSIEARQRYNYDQPTAWERDRLVRDLKRLHAGEAIEMPLYDFTSHSRRKECKHLDPRPYIVAEGIFALCYPELDAFADLAVFVDVDDAEALQRRIRRDVCERGRKVSCVTEQFNRTVLPAVHAYIRPSAANADLVLSGTAPPNESVDQILQQLEGGP
ncbi:uridine kinase [Coraliomargarita parva]|uniref:uridine kinase n=1 Tax=Coraliomargarita parva TaxID=3014050 RepID=UPI0022B4C922|nr:uridine kinase [Coraliomargarita parva]